MIFARPFTRIEKSNHDYMTTVTRIYEFGFRGDYMDRIDPEWYFIVCGKAVKINTGTDKYDQVVRVGVRTGNNLTSNQLHYHGDVFYSFYSSSRVLKFDNLPAFLNAFEYGMDKEQHKVFDQLHMLEVL